jgi:HK97 family phage major capsid protein
MAERAFSIGQSFKRAPDGGDLIVEMAFASEVPYERWWGTEVLQMKGARLDRLNSGDGGPVLYNHNWDDLRGRHMPGSVRADSDGVLRGQISIPQATQATRDAAALIESKTLTKASVGYQIHKVIEQTTSKSGEKAEREIDGATFERLLKDHAQTRDGRPSGGDLVAFRRGLDEAAGPVDRAPDTPPVYLVTDWEPLENSLVTIPADNSVGVGRSLEVSPPAAQAVIPAAPAAIERKAMTVETQAAAGNAEQVVNLTPVQIEQERRAAIQALVKANRLDSRTEEKWIRDGTPLHKIADDILSVMEERGKTNPDTAASLGLSRSETTRYSMFRAIRALHFGGRNPEFVREAAFEIECSQAIGKALGRGQTSNILIPSEILQRPLGVAAATRAMGTQPGSKGGYMVNVDNMGFIDILRNRSVAMAMGARNLPGLQGNVMFPRQTGKVTVTWQAGEGTSITAADQALGQLSMTPKTCIAITDVSEQLLRQASPSAEAFVMADLAADVAIDGIDAAVINGTGGAQPLGIKNTTGITSGQDAATATYAKILAFVSTAGALNAIRGRPGFVTTTAGAAVLMQKQRFTSTDTPVWEGNMMDGTLVGFNAMSSEQLASGNLIFGSWDEVVIGDWGVLELATDNGGTRFNQAQVGIRAMWMVDVLVRYPQAFVVSTNLSA